MSLFLFSQLFSLFFAEFFVGITTGTIVPHITSLASPQPCSLSFKNQEMAFVSHFLHLGHPHNTDFQKADMLSSYRMQTECATVLY